MIHCMQFLGKYHTQEEKNKMEKSYIMEHPLIQHKIFNLRDKNTGTNEFS